MKRTTFYLFVICLFSFAFSCETPKPAEKKVQKADNSACIDQAKVNPNQPCTKEFRPVCACDRKTYGNRCLAEREGIKHMTEGRCHPCQDATLIGQHTPILRVVKPVCGCNGVTYDNESLAKNAGIMKFTEGACQSAEETCIDEKKIDPKKKCGREYAPVCGCDGKTYTNSCEAEKAGVTRYATGECHECQETAKIGTHKQVMRMIKYVCGCNGVTYDNQTLARNAGIMRWKLGRCEDGKVENDCITANVRKKDCPENWDPVCGCDGKTYGNECAAKNAGVRTWKKGECNK